MGRKLSTDLFFLISIILVVAIGVLSQQSTSVTKSILKNNFRQVTITEGEYYWGEEDPGQGQGTSLLAFDDDFLESPQCGHLKLNKVSDFLLNFSKRVDKRLRNLISI